MFDYSRPLGRAEVEVHLLDLGGSPRFTEVRRRVQDAGDEYGFTVIARSGLLPRPTSDGEDRYRLLLVIAEVPFDRPLVEHLLDEELAHYSVISLAFAYDGEEEMFSHADAIEKYKRLANDRINFLRPCAAPDGRWTVPMDKLVDNAICDSVRIKYRPVNLDPGPLALPGPVREFFTTASQLFEQYRLYHRSASDGYFAVRAPGREHFYITATKSYKNPLDLRRVVLVERYDEDSNTLYFRGPYLPSSDSVEASVVFAHQPEVTSIVHTHASSAFTRNPAFRHRVLVGAERYGELRLGKLVVAALATVDDGFLIMEDHGEVFAHHEPVVSPTLLSLLD